MTKYVGVDWASRKGWLCVVIEEGNWSAEMQPSMLSVWHHHSDADTVLVDIPIGLPEDERRTCDEEAKDYLGPERRSSVFYTPCRAAVEAGSYDEASSLNKKHVGYGLSSQAWGIVPRIREVDEFLSEVEPGETLREAHPEVAFAGLTGGEAISTSKQGDDGIEARLDALEKGFDDASEAFRNLVKKHIDCVAPWQRRIGTANRDDLLDAMVLALIGQCSGGDFETLPVEPSTDEVVGRQIEICYYEP